MKSIKKFEKFIVSNEESIKAGRGVVCWVGSDGNGNSLMDILDTDSGVEEHCSVNDYDLGYEVGDTVYSVAGGGSTTKTATAVSNNALSI